jgi:ribose 5-phosphate isomerase RpiB
MRISLAADVPTGVAGLLAEELTRADQAIVCCWTGTGAAIG